jgi:hypothetical protein
MGVKAFFTKKEEEEIKKTCLIKKITEKNKNLKKDQEHKRREDLIKNLFKGGSIELKKNKVKCLLNLNNVC